ncbi:tyrosine-type recombinase/integrase [Alkalihalobacillus sp. 1P02AB]|uniref:site-specific integrase n=1 Tax=Alkalihalobacillus sp. 1P02AB TaxID=3132260 RepID=UPI0039A62A3A
MASIKKDKNGTYFFIFNVANDPVTKKRKQYKRRGFESKEEAELALAKLRIELKQNFELLKGTNSKFDSFINDWLTAKKIKLKPSTIKNYEEQLLYNILPYLGDIKITEINEDIIQNYIMKLHKERNLSPATIRTAYGIVAEVLKKALKKRLIKEDFLSDISLPREIKKDRAWSEEDIITFLDAPKRILNLTRHYIGFVISIQTGMRMGEVLGLRWKDIDFNNNLIYVKQTLAKNLDGSYSLVNGGKSDSAIRVIYISESLTDLLHQHKRFLDNEIDIIGNDYHKYNLIVCTQTGNWVHPNNFRRAFRVTVKQLDLPRIRMHDLRHTHATYLLSKRINPKIIQERLGHKNVNILLNTYSHVLPSMQIEAVSKLDELFSKSDQKSDLS